MDSLFSVKGKNVLITGGSRGIGLMIARCMVAQGANILLSSRDATACEEAARSIVSFASLPPPANTNSHSSTASAGTCHHVSSNVSTREGCRELARHAHEVFRGRLDVLVNNAGCSWGEELDRESGRSNWGWDKVLDLNVKGIFYLTRECVPMLERRQPNGTKSTITTDDDPGRVINIGSVAGMIPMETPTHAYDVSKAAVHHLTKKMAADLAKRGITVNAVAPGFVETKMSDGLAMWIDSQQQQGDDTKKNQDDDDEEPEEDNLLGRGIPLGRMGTEEDMAGACIYFSSRAGAWCTGVILNVDGGTAGCLQLPLSSSL